MAYINRAKRWVLALLVSLALIGNRSTAQAPPTDANATEASPTMLPAPESLKTEERDPFYLRRPLDGPAAPTEPAAAEDGSLLQTPVFPPLGYTGPSSVFPRETQSNSDFVPVEDRWRGGFPPWDRYGLGHPFGNDYPYVEGHFWDPYNQNVIKGDYPIIGQNTFLNVTASSLMIMEPRQVPTATTAFESTQRPFEEENFQKPNQFFYTHFFSMSFDLFHGDTAAFKPVDWRVKVTPIFNVNYLAVDELGVVNPDVRKGTTRGRSWFALEEWFLETKLADSSPDFDFLSVRAGSQPFTSDFRGFIFNDINRGVRLFGTRFSNRDQFNLVYFRQLEKDTNSMLNTFNDRHQDVLIANYFRQDFIWPGYTTQFSVHYDHDSPTFKYDTNNFLVRPDPVGVFAPHTVNAAYLGWAGDGHINRFNISHAFYWALGRDSLNPLANQAVDINAQMGAIELSYDRDWARFRASFFYASGDSKINDSHATGFDSILDNPNFAGGQFSYWQRQTIKLFGVNLVQRESLIPDLRSSKIQGQANFVNPGLVLGNGGVDFDLTPKIKMINNVNFLWFDEVAVLQQFLFQGNMHYGIGTDLSTGIEYRPFLNNNTIIVAGLSSLLPGQGFRDIFNNLQGTTGPLLASFLTINLNY